MQNRALKPGHSPGTAGDQSAEKKGRLDRARVRLTPVRSPKGSALPRRLYDLKAISGYLGIPVHTVRELLWRGDLAYVRIGRRQYVDIKDVDGLIEQNKVREVRCPEPDPGLPRWARRRVAAVPPR